MSENTGTEIIAPIVPRTTNDNYPTHFEKYGKGGYRTVLTLAERDGLPEERRSVGMLVNVLEDGLIYKLDIDLTTWSVLETGGGGGGSLDDLSDVVLTAPVNTHQHLKFDGNNWVNTVDYISQTVNQDIDSYISVSGIADLATGADVFGYFEDYAAGTNNQIDLMANADVATLSLMTVSGNGDDFNGITITSTNDNTDEARGRAYFRIYNVANNNTVSETITRVMISPLIAAGAIEPFYFVAKDAFTNLQKIFTIGSNGAAQVWVTGDGVIHGDGSGLTNLPVVSDSGKEDSLGNPTVDGYVLSSTALGVRSWIEPPTGGVSIIVSDTMPVAPAQNTLWLDISA